jgi:hypothetical protein
MFIIKFFLMGLFLVILFVIGVFIAGAVFIIAQFNRKRNKQSSAIEELRPCPRCGTYISLDQNHVC